MAEERSPTVALGSFAAQVQIHVSVVLVLTVALVLACFVLERKAARTVKADEG
jgi:uncharacterized membrane protein YwaF